MSCSLKKILTLTPRKYLLWSTHTLKGQSNEKVCELISSCGFGTRIVKLGVYRRAAVKSLSNQ
jgi:hypothetical protein